MRVPLLLQHKTVMSDSQLCVTGVIAFTHLNYAALSILVLTSLWTQHFYPQFCHHKLLFQRVIRFRFVKFSIRQATFYEILLKARSINSNSLTIATAAYLQIIHSLNFKRPMINIRFKSAVIFCRLCILPTQFIRMIHVILSINPSGFTKGSD